MVVGGYFTRTNASRIARLTATGSLDSSFITGSGFDNSVNTLLVQPDGKLLVGGDFTSYNGTLAVNRIARLSTTGALDAAFTTAAGTAFNGGVSSLNLQADGKILAVGSFSVFSATTRNHLARLNGTGALDSTFLGTVSGPSSTTYSVATQGTPTSGDGKVVIAGSFTSVNNSTSIYLARLGAADGVLDPTFSAPTIQSWPYSSNQKILSYASDGSLLYGGRQTYFKEGYASSLVLLEAAPVVSITSQPTNQTGTLGSAVTFSVVAAGESPVYQWFRNGLAISGATSATYTISSAQLSDVGSYTAQISNLYSTVTSNAVTLTGSSAAPTIATQPANATVVAGASGTLSVSATGGTLAYQWRKLGVPIAGQTSSTLTLSAVSLADAGLYDVQISNGLTSTTSLAARIDVRPASFPSGVLRPRPGFNPKFENNSSASAVIAAPGGAFYLVGDFASVDGVARSGVARFLASGALDTNFVPPVINGNVRAAVLQGSGASAKLIIGGIFDKVAGVIRYGVARLDAATGAFDSSFTPSTNDWAYALALQSDGKLIVGYGGSIRRVDGINGAADSTFSGGSFDNTAYAVAIDASGRVLVGGDFTSYDGSVVNRVIRLSSAGVLDTAFSAAVGTTLSSGVRSLAIYPGAAGTGNGGKIVIGGNFTGTTRSYLTRLNDDGSVDAGFMAVGTGFNSNVNSIVIQTDGRLLVGGQFTSISGGATSATATTRNRIARLDGTTGLVESFYPADGLNSTVNGLALTTDGKVVLAGGFSTLGSATRIGVARIDGTTGALDSTLTAILRMPALVNAVVPVAGGKYVVTGDFNWANQVAVGRLARIDGATGALDTTFGTNIGTGLNSTGRALAIQGDGKIIVGGNFSTFNGVNRAGVARLSADGVLDTSYVPESSLYGINSLEHFKLNYSHSGQTNLWRRWP